MEPNAQQRAGNENAIAKASCGNMAIAHGGSLSGNASTVGLAATIYPNVCPGCGRCKDCGQPYPQPNPQLPYIPYVPYTIPQPQPYWGQPVITCGGTSQLGANLGTVTINSHNTADDKPIYPISQTNPY